jgi:hypothetical protein
MEFDPQPTLGKEDRVVPTRSQVSGRVASYLHFFFAVLAESLKFLAVGAPLDPGLRIFSPDPEAILFLLA